MRLGKILRHLDPRAMGCEIHGCDIHEPSIRWVQDNLDPSFDVFSCEERPPLDRPDGHFDLVWAMSVFTHLSDLWAEWLLEIHRVLAPGGRLVATFLGEGMSGSIAGEPWDPGRVGMNVLRNWQGWERGGPSVQHSEWWLREHWGRLFEIEDVEDGQRAGHGVITLRRREVSLSADDLRARGDDPREWRAIQHNLRQLEREAAELASERDALGVDRDAIDHERWDVARQRDSLVRALDAVQSSRSRRMTAPLRDLLARRRS